MQKERAASALERGLPVPTPLPKRAAQSAVPRARPNIDSPERGSSPTSSNQRMPLAVKLLGLGLGVLGLVYGLTLFRDHKSNPVPAAVRANVTGAEVK
jgi:hypothetical protein